MAGYGDNTGLQAWADARGYVFDSSSDLGQLREIGSTWLDATYGARFRGVPTGGVSQERQWPRTNAIVYGAEVDNSTVPAAIITASYMAAWQEETTAGSLFGTIATGTGQVKREKVGPIEQEFFGAKDTQKTDGPYDPNIAPSGSLMIPQIEQMLKPYMVLADWNVDITAIGRSTGL